MRCGVKKVYLASAAPPCGTLNVYGIMAPAPSEFVAHKLSEEEVADYIGVDWLRTRILRTEKSARWGLIQRLRCSIVLCSMASM